MFMYQIVRLFAFEIRITKIEVKAIMETVVLLVMILVNCARLCTTFKTLREVENRFWPFLTVFRKPNEICIYGS